MKYNLADVCVRLSSGKGIPAKMIESSGRFPVYGGNGLRGYTEQSNFEGNVQSSDDKVHFVVM